MSNLTVVTYSKAIDIQEYLMIYFEKCYQKFMHMQTDGLNLIVFMECFHFIKTISSAIEKYRQSGLSLYWCKINQVNQADSGLIQGLNQIEE